MAERSVIVAGAGIAGLTAALAFAAKGFTVTVYERTKRLDEAGAGLQISPNATRVLKELGVLERLEHSAVRPSSIMLKSASSLATLARVPLGEEAERRWGAPYLVAHRADLQRALLHTVSESQGIRLQTHTEVQSAAFGQDGVAVTIQENDAAFVKTCDLLIGADGVWSKLRHLVDGGRVGFSGHVAFRTILSADKIASHSDKSIFAPDAVNAYLAPGFHMVAYPLRGGEDVNLVAVTSGTDMPARWTNEADTTRLAATMTQAAPILARAVAEAKWTAWPIHCVTDLGQVVHRDGLALIGDAAHAFTPYAAQGAAMAIEDAALLADLAARATDMSVVPETFQRIRRPRLERVMRRGGFNRFVWHASGPVAFGRNLVLRLRSETTLAADLDWLYGYNIGAETGSMPKAYAKI